MSPRPGVTIIVHRDGEVESKSIRFPGWLWRALVIGGVVGGAAIVLGAALYIPVIRTAARVPALERQVADLENETGKIRELAAALDSADARYARVRTMLGADAPPADALPDGSSPVPAAPALRAELASQRPTTPPPLVPAWWPLDEPGYVTQGEVGNATDGGTHPGIDIAVPIGSLVRAAASGTVLDAGVDPEYGNFVLIQHAQDYQTMYGHLSRILAADGAAIEAGQVIGLSGNTGRSTAPHLHFEIRLQGAAIDPLTMVKEGSR
jgi:murein DD-endopeptidase MepM/ murein hydrolase activator NlpD